MKTPEEIKKGLECCYSPVDPMLRCEACPYYGSIVCKMCLHTDALALIQRLEADNAKKDENIQMLQDGNASLMKTIDEACEKTVRLERERDAAVNGLVGTCQVCLWEGTAKCATCHFNAEAWNVHESNWEWRGAPEQEKNEPIRAD